MTSLLLAFALVSQTPTVPYVPSETTVAILPVVNTTGDKFLEMKAKQIGEGNETLARLFKQRGFTVLGQDAVAQAIKETGVDFSDEENNRREPLYSVGAAAKARLVVFSVITRTWQKTTKGGLFERQEGFSSIKTWVLDVQERKALLSGDVVEGSSAMNSNRGSDRQVRAVRLGLERQFEPLLKGYPVATARL